MRELYSVHQVFTPTTQARLNFVPRRVVNDRLVDALNTPGKQLIVYGESGSGKSTLLLRKLQETYAGHITTRCHASTRFDQIVLSAFDALGVYYIEGKSSSVGRSTRSSLSADFMRIHGAIEGSQEAASGEQQKRIVPPQLTPQRLGEFLGAQQLCWVIEDFHKIDSDEKTNLSQALKIFSDLSEEFPHVKIVTVGATDTARQVVEYDREMARRVSELAVPLMDDDELAEIMTNGAGLLNANLDALINDVVAYSVGVPSVCHQLALNACLEQGLAHTSPIVVTFDQNHLKSATLRYVSESSDTLKATFDRALRRHKVRKYDNCRLILAALASGPLEGMLRSEILSKIKQRETDYPTGNLTQYLVQLTGEQRGEILRLGLDGRYRFQDPIYHTYAQVKLNSPRATMTSRLQVLVSDFLSSEYAFEWKPLSLRFVGNDEPGLVDVEAPDE